MRRYLLALLLVSACMPADGSAGVIGPEGPQGPAGAMGTAGTPGAGVVAGSRLRPRYLVADDGTKAPAGYWDTRIDMACEFALSTDGVQRCLPTLELTEGPYLFADPRCTQRVIYAYVGGLTYAKAASENGLLGVPSTYSGYSLSVFRPVTIYASRERCEAQGVDSRATYYRATEISPSDMVGAVLR